MNSRYLMVGLKIGAFGLLVFVAGSCLILGAIAYAYQDTFYPGIKVAGIDLSGQGQAEGSRLVKSKANQYLEQKIVVTVPNIAQPRSESSGQYPDVEITTQAKDLGLEFGTDQIVARSWEIGRNRQVVVWLKEIVPILFQGQNMSLPYSLDQTKIKSFIHTQVMPKIVNPTPAKLVVKGNEVLIEDPKPGLTVNQEALTTELALHLESDRETEATYLRAPIQEVASPITRQTVQPMANRLDAIGNLKISFSAEKITLTPKREEILRWYTPTQDEKGTISLVLQKDDIAQFLAKNRNLDQDKSLKQALKSLTALADQELTKAAPGKALAVVVTAKPVVTNEALPGSYTLGKYASKYVEVNLAEQKLYLINGLTLEKTYRVSTGKWITPTPVGEFSIGDKVRRAYSPQYGLYMPYWQSFLNDAYGIHELPEWPNGYKEGASHLGTPVSHGCIRLGVGAAQEVYNWTSPGTPVYIH